MKTELVRVGTERARSLGWTDCYTFTKALGERVVEAYAAEQRRVSIVRPSIIESALRSPTPAGSGGFKMAEPLIPRLRPRRSSPDMPGAAGHDRRHRPGRPRGRRAIVAVLAHPPQPGDPAYFHVSSGDRNPLTFGTLYQNVRDYFDAHPFTLRRPAARPGCRVAVPQARRRSNGCSAPVSGRSRSPTTCSGTRRAATARATSRASSTSRAGGWSSCAATWGLYQEYAQAGSSSPTATRSRSTARCRAGPGDVRLRHRGRRLEGLPAGDPLPGGHRADPTPRRGARRPQAPDGHGQGPLRQARHRGVLRHGRHVAVLRT